MNNLQNLAKAVKYKDVVKQKLEEQQEKENKELKEKEQQIQDELMAQLNTQKATILTQRWTKVREMRDNIRNSIKAKRQSLMLSQKELALMANVSQATISALERDVNSGLSPLLLHVMVTLDMDISIINL